MLRGTVLRSSPMEKAAAGRGWHSMQCAPTAGWQSPRGQIAGRCRPMNALEATARQSRQRTRRNRMSPPRLLWLTVQPSIPFGPSRSLPLECLHSPASFPSRLASSRVLGATGHEPRATGHRRVHCPARPVSAAKPCHHGWQSAPRELEPAKSQASARGWQWMGTERRSPTCRGHSTRRLAVAPTFKRPCGRRVDIREQASGCRRRLGCAEGGAPAPMPTGGDAFPIRE